MGGEGQEQSLEVARRVGADDEAAVQDEGERHHLKRYKSSVCSVHT
jgi:hypothetical protein